jgi:hypothetical protein
MAGGIVQDIFLMNAVSLFTAWATLLTMAAHAAPTLDKATITYIQNDVAVADIKLLSLEGGKVKKVNAALNQPITKENAVVTGDKSRAELKFNDGTVARLGQFTVFSFKEGTRDIDLKQGSTLLNVPKGLGRTNIKAAAVTAAITGTTVLVQTFGNFGAIYVYEGSVEYPGPPVTVLGPGDVLIVEDGKFRVEKFDIAQGVQTAGLFTKFTASPNNGPFTLEQILSLIAQDLGVNFPDNFDDNQKVDAILNRLIEVQIEDERNQEPFDPYLLF